MGVQMTGQVTARSFVKRDPHFNFSGPIILGKTSHLLGESPCSSSQSRQSHGRLPPRRQPRLEYSLFSYLKRWIAEIWYGIIKRVKSIFLARSDGKERSSKIDSEVENVFRCSPRWDRKHLGIGDHADRKWDQSYPDDSFMSFDEECSAIVNGKEASFDDGCVSSDADDHFKLQGPSKDEISATRTEGSQLEGPQDNAVGEWVQTDCAGEVWCSQSELDTVIPELKPITRPKRPSSRIPRLCTRSKKSVINRY